MEQWVQTVCTVPLVVQFCQHTGVLPLETLSVSFGEKHIVACI